VAKSIMRKRDSLDWRFDVQNKGKVVRAAYTGIVPDTFKDDAEVVLKGTLGPDGFHVEKDGVLAKCPSKYEARPGGSAGTN
jgi:cytochrome c-type biogenesis protein CcmE